MRRPSFPRRLGGPRLWLAVLVAAALVGASGVAAVYGTGYPPARVTLAAGTAWLASPGQQLVTLVDGPSELVVGSVRLPVRADGEVVQVGSSALVVDPDAGTVRRVDGATYEVSDPVRFAPGGLAVLAGRSVAYVVDTVRRTASSLDPATLTAGAEVALAATPGPGQTVVDDTDRLWVVDGTSGGLAGFARDGRTAARSTAAGPTAQLTLVQGRAAVVDPARKVAGLVDDDGGVGKPACFPADDVAGMQLLGSGTSPRLYAAVPGTGTLLVSDLDTGACPVPVPVGRPGDRFGPLVESSGFVLVPDETTGTLAAVDVKGGVVREQLPVLATSPSKLELVAKDGLVFYNDLVGERAGVIRFDGRWTASAGEKFRVRDGQPDTVLASGAGDIPPGAAPPAPPPRGRAATSGGRAPVAPVAGGPPPAPVPPPTVPPPTVPPPTAAPTEVRVPAFGVVGQEYGNALFYIRQRIAEACAPGPPCLTPTTQVTAAAPAPAGPCVITQEPAPGLPVARGSTLTFFVDRPCTTGTTASPTASASSEPTTEPPPSEPPPSVIVDPAPPQLTRVPLEPPVRVPAPDAGPTTTVKPKPKPKPKPSAVVVEPSQAEVQQAPDDGTPSP